MTSNRSFFNKNYFKQNLKQHQATQTISIIAFFILMILPVLVGVNHVLEYASFRLENIGAVEERIVSVIHPAFKVQNEFMRSAMIVGGIVVASNVFKYLHSKKQVDFFHSIPISRKTLFFNNYITGIFMVLPVFWATYIISYGIASVSLSSFGGVNLDIQSMVMSVIIHSLVFIMSYTTSVIANILVGNSIIGYILSALLLSAMDMILNVEEALRIEFLYNMYNIEPFFSMGTNSPIINLYHLTENNMRYTRGYGVSFLYSSTVIQAVAIYSVFTLIVIFVAYKLFEKRPSESAGNCMSFAITKPIFKYLGVVLYSILIAIFTYNVFSTSKEIALYIGLAIATVILHCAVEAIYDFDVKSMFKNYKSIFGCFIISACIIFGYQSDIFGLNNELYAVDEVESVTIGSQGVFDSSYGYGMHSNSDSNFYRLTPEVSNFEVFFEDEENIAKVIDMHNISNETRRNNQFDFNSEHYVLEYKLKSGKTIMRRIIVSEHNYDIAKQLITTEEYVNQHGFFNDKANENVEFENINIIGTNAEFANIKDDREILDGFLEALILDINNNGLRPSDDIVYMSFGNKVSGKGALDEYYSDSGLYYKDFVEDEAEGIFNFSEIYIYKEYTNTIEYIENNIEFRELTLPDLGKNIHYDYSTEQHAIRECAFYEYDYEMGDYREDESLFFENVSTKDVFDILENGEVTFEHRYKNNYYNSDSEGLMALYAESNNRTIRIDVYFDKDKMEYLKGKYQ